MYLSMYVYIYIYIHICIYIYIHMYIYIYIYINDNRVKERPLMIVAHECGRVRSWLWEICRTTSPRRSAGFAR